MDHLKKKVGVFQSDFQCIDSNVITLNVYLMYFTELWGDGQDMLTPYTLVIVQ